ncbi:MAG TPA: carboxyl transferase domain-containing protein, partial [Solimonas sp.]|nr:carboxyl transferase domain-containing protein [Solimonas sp.]
MKRQTPAAPDPLDELAAREARARAMGGADKLARQHAKGRLDARQRIARLLDGGAFDEHGLLAASDMPAMAERTPADGKVCGWGAIDARPVFVSADDVTVFAGAGGRVGVGKQYEGMKYAVQKGYPCVHLGDAGGARVPDIMGPRRHGVCEARGAGAEAGAPSLTRFASRRHR